MITIKAELGSMITLSADSLSKLRINPTDTLYVPAATIRYFYSYETKNGDYKSSSNLIMHDGDASILQLPRNITKLKEVINTIQKDPYSLGKSLTTSKINFEFVDTRVENPLKNAIELKEGFLLKTYQKTPVEDAINYLKTGAENSTILQAPPGFGKTFILPKILKEVGQRTLILVDRTDLVSQMHDELTSNIEGLEVNVLSKKNMTLKEINVTTFQFLMANPDFVSSIRKEIGFIIVDECHSTPADKFLATITRFPAKYRLGLSATPTRSDGLTEVLSDVFSDNKVIAENPDNLKVQMVFVKTGITFRLKNMTKYAEEYTKFITQPKVAIQVLTVLESLLKKKRAIYLYADKEKSQQFYATELTNKGYNVEVINGKTPKDTRKKILNDFRKGKVDFLISGVILQKGISLHNLDTIVNISSHTKEGFEQTIGRLRRHDENKKPPLFIDFIYGGNLRKQASIRTQTAHKLRKEHNDKVINITYPELEFKLTKGDK